MYAALLEKKLVTAIEEASQIYQQKKRLNFDNYYCPQCKQRVILVISQCKMPFFKHLKLISGEGEKEEHFQSKKILCASLVALGWPAQVEVPLADQQLRADILAQPKLAFEIQCAPLSKQEYLHRHNLYRQIGIKDIWIVGKRHYLTKNLRESQKIFLRKNKKWGFYYLEIAPFKNQLFLKYDICLEAMTNKLQYETACFSLDETGVRNFLNYRPDRLTPKSCNYQDQFNYLYRQLREKTKLGLEMGRLLYERQLTIHDLPVELFTKCRSPLSRPTVLLYLDQEKKHS